MEIKDFIDKLAEVLDDMDPSTITPNTRFRELNEWSSLSALALMAMVDEEYDVDLKGEEIKGAETVENLFKVVQDKA